MIPDVEELNYDEDRNVDPDALDVEWLDQGRIAAKYIKNEVYKKELAKLAHERVKTIRSDLINAVNKDPIKTTNKKSPNAADIEAYYRRNSEYKEAKETWIKAESDALFAELARKEICFTRKEVIQGLAQLHAQGWFAGPSIPRDLTKEWEKRRAESNELVKIKQRPKRTR